MEVERVAWSNRPPVGDVGPFDDAAISEWDARCVSLFGRLRHAGLLCYDGDIVDIPHNLLLVVSDMPIECHPQMQRSWWFLQAKVFELTGLLFSESSCRAVHDYIKVEQNES